MIEALFAANGYAIEIPLQTSANGTSALVMTCGAASILFGQVADSNRVELEVWGRDLVPGAARIGAAARPFTKPCKGFVRRCKAIRAK